RDHFAVGARAQGLERWQRRAVAQEAHGAVGEGEVGPARVAAAEGADPIIQRLTISAGRHPVVDRRSSMKHDVCHRPLVLDVIPTPQCAYGKYSGQKNGLEAVEFRVTMVALAEEEGVSGAVGDVLKANAAVNPEDAVPRYAGKSRGTAHRNRALAGAAAITAHPVETPGPRGVDRVR